jgi:hypothetical protein
LAGRRWLDNYQKLRRSRRFANSNTTCCARMRPRRRAGGRSVIEMRRTQLSFDDGLIAEEVSDLREDGRGVRSSGETASPRVAAAAGRALRPKWRCVILVHICNRSYCTPEREVRVSRFHPRGRRQDARRQDHRSLVLRCGAGGRQTDPPKDGDDRAGHRGDGRAQDAGGHHGVETNIHYPTGSAIWLIAQVAANQYSALRTRVTKRAGTTATIGRFFVPR